MGVVIMYMGFYDMYFEKIAQCGGIRNYVERKKHGLKGIMIKRLVQNLNYGCKILEVGTGTGILAALLAKKGFNVTAIDCDEKMLGLAKECFHTLHVSVTLLKINLFEINNYSGSILNSPLLTAPRQSLRRGLPRV